MTGRSAPAVAVLSRPIFNRLSSTLSKAKIKSIRSGWLISDDFLDETLAPVRFVYHLRAQLVAEFREPTLRMTMLPRDTNAHGTIFGGVILSPIDFARAIACHQRTA